MANNRSGLALGVNVGFETAFNAGDATPKGHTVPRAALRFAAVEEPGESPEVLYNPNPAAAIPGLYKATGEVGAVVTADVAPLLFKAFTGNITSAGTAAPVTHSSKLIANDMVSLWLEKWYADITKGDLYNGVRVAGMKLSWKKEAQPLIATLSLIGSGKRTLNGGTQYDATPSAYTDARLSVMSTVLKIAGTATALVKSFDVSIMLEYARQDVLDGNDYAVAVDPGAAKIEANIDALWDSADTLRGYAGLTKSCELICYRPGATTRYVSILFPEVRFTDSNVPDESGRGPIAFSSKLSPYYATATEGTAVVLTAVNDKAIGFYV